jgi:hypothetical protein
MVLETVLYAGSAGVSQVALLVAIAFWTAVWGPIGLLLATPLTVCLVVLGKHVPALRFLVVMMTDERVVSADVGYYQRLLADDRDAALAYMDAYRREHRDADHYDAILLPALQHARRDRIEGAIEEKEEARMVEVIARMVEQLDDAGVVLESGEPRAAVLGCPALDRSDEVALRMLARLTAAQGIAMEVLPASLLTSEVVSQIATRRPNAVVVGSLPPGGLAESRHLCKRLQATSPRPWVLVGRWRSEVRGNELEGLGMTVVVGSLAEACAQLSQFARTTRAADAAA